MGSFTRGVLAGLRATENSFPDGSLGDLSAPVFRDLRDNPHQRLFLTPQPSPGSLPAMLENGLRELLVLVGAETQWAWFASTAAGR
jgi:hypothetical protein